jgi:hypothetical protein
MITMQEITGKMLGDLLMDKSTKIKNSFCAQFGTFLSHFPVFSLLNRLWVEVEISCERLKAFLEH